MNHVAEITYYDLTDDTEYTVLLGSTGFSTRPTDTPGDYPVEGCIENPGSLRRDVFDVGTLGGASREGYGDLVLRNDGGLFDWLNTVGLDGFPVTLRCCDTLAAYPSGWTTLLTGILGQPSVALDRVSLTLRDRNAFASAPFQTAKYGGTNVLPDGVDGLETDLQGKPKPVVLGAVFNIEPLCVNTAKLVYQIHDGVNWGALLNITSVYDSGALLSQAADYVDQADMLANAPVAGSFRVWRAGGMMRLGSTPVGQLTCDAVQGTTPDDRTAAALFRVVCEAMGFASLDISAADCAALDVLTDATLGLYIREETTYAQVLDMITKSVGAWWSCDASGVMRIQRLDAPSGTPVLALTGDDLTERSLARVPLNENGLPVHRVTVRAARNHTVQTSGLVGIVGSARRARLAQPFQDAVASDLAVQAAYPLSPEMIVETALACLGDATEEAQRLLALYAVQRDRFEVTIHANAALMGAVALGSVISLTYNRFDLDAGKLFRVLGYQLSPESKSVTLTVWG